MKVNVSISYGDNRVFIFPLLVDVSMKEKWQVHPHLPLELCSSWRVTGKSCSNHFRRQKAAYLVVFPFF